MENYSRGADHLLKADFSGDGSLEGTVFWKAQCFFLPARIAQRYSNQTKLCGHVSCQTISHGDDDACLVVDHPSLNPFIPGFANRYNLPSILLSFLRLKASQRAGQLCCGDTYQGLTVDAQKGSCCLMLTFIPISGTIDCDLEVEGLGCDD